MRIDAVPIGRNPPEDVNVIVEVPIGGAPVKYEMDKAAGTLRVDRLLFTAMRYPGNYGFVPHTLAEDGDPIDVLVANEIPIVPGAVINCRPVGVLRMQDEAGPDEKIIAVPSQAVSAMYGRVVNYRDLPDMLLRQISHFFERYKELEEGKWVKIEGWEDAASAHALILRAIERAQAEPAQPR
jgi:inorganic pyrophosphatase